MNNSFENPVSSSDPQSEENMQEETGNKVEEAEIPKESESGEDIRHDQEENGNENTEGANERTAETEGEREKEAYSQEDYQEVLSLKEKYAEDLELGEDFDAASCEETAVGLNGLLATYSKSDEFKKAMSTHSELAISVDMRRLNGEDALAESKYFEVQANISQLRVDILKATYLEKLEKSLLAGDAGLEEFIKKDHFHLAESIRILEDEVTYDKAQTGIFASQANMEQPENVQSTQEQRSGETPQEGSKEKAKALGEKAWEGGKGLGWAGAILVFGLSRIFSGKKLDEWMEKWTKKKLNPKLKSGGNDSK